MLERSDMDNDHLWKIIFPLNRSFSFLIKFSELRIDVRLMVINLVLDAVPNYQLEYRPLVSNSPKSSN